MRAVKYGFGRALRRQDSVAPGVELRIRRLQLRVRQQIFHRAADTLGHGNAGREIRHEPLDLGVVKAHVGGLVAQQRTFKIIARGPAAYGQEFAGDICRAQRRTHG